MVFLPVGSFLSVSPERFTRSSHESRNAYDKDESNLFHKELNSFVDWSSIRVRHVCGAFLLGKHFRTIFLLIFCERKAESGSLLKRSFCLPPATVLALSFFNATDVPTFL